MPALSDAARAQFADVVGRPEFFKLDEKVQRQVIRQIAPGFAKLTPQGQDAAFQAVVTDPQLRGKAFGTVKQAPSKAKALLREVPPVASGVAGALAGAALTGGSPIGAAIGSTLMAAGGEAITERVAGEPTQPKRIALRGLEAGGGEVGGRTIARVAGRIAAPVTGKVASRAAREDIAFLGEAAPPIRKGAFGPSGVRGIAQRLGTKEQAILPAQVTESKTISFLQNVAEGGIFSGSELERLSTEVQPRILLNKAATIGEMAGKQLDSDQLAAAFKAGIDKRIDARNVVIQNLYASIDKTTGIVRKKVPVTRIIDTGLVNAKGNPIKRVVTELVERDVSPVNANIEKLKAFAEPLAKQAERLQMVGSENVGDREILRIARLENEIPFTDVAELRSRLLTARRELETSPTANRKAIGRLKKMIGILDKAAESALGDQVPELLPVFRRANELVTRRETELNNRLLRGFVRSADVDKVGVPGAGKPETLLKQVFRSPTALRTVRKALGKDSEEYTSLIRGFVSQILKPEVDGKISGKIIQSRIAKDISLINELPPQLRKNVFAFGRAAARQQQQEVSGIGKVGIGLVQFGQVASIAGAFLSLNVERLKDPQAAGGFLLVAIAPNVAGRLLANPVTAKLFIKSLRLSPGTRAAAGTAGQLFGALTRITTSLDQDLPIFDENGQRLDQPPAPAPQPTAEGRPIAAGP